MKLSEILKYSGIVIGIVAALSLVSKHPILIFIMGIGAASYFAGKYYDKQGK